MFKTIVPVFLTLCAATAFAEINNPLPSVIKGTFKYSSQVQDWHGYVSARPRGNLKVAALQRRGVQIDIPEKAKVTRVRLYPTGRYRVDVTTSEGTVVREGRWTFRNRQIFARSKGKGSAYVSKDKFSLATYDKQRPGWPSPLSLFFLNPSKGIRHGIVYRKR